MQWEYRRTWRTKCGPFLAKKEWGCGIILLETTLSNDTRWRSLLHEALHSVSVGLTEKSYERFAPWEEAAVKSLQRLYRPLLLQRLRLDIAESRFAAVEKNWRHNQAVNALQQIIAECPDVTMQDFGTSEVQAERELVLSALDRALAERTPDVVREAGVLAWDWVRRYPEDYAVWDAGEPIAMLPDALKISAGKAQAHSREPDAAFALREVVSPV